MLNRVILDRTVNPDPELRYTPAGVAVTQFTLAVDRPFTSQGGEKEADFIPVVTLETACRDLCELLAQRTPGCSRRTHSSTELRE